VRDIPYLDSELRLQWGAMVSKLVAVDRDAVKAENHQIWWAGSRPHGLDGQPVRGLGGGAAELTVLSEKSKDLVVQYRFSHKIKEGGNLRDYVNHLEMIEEYVAMISGPAMTRFKVDPYTWREVEDGPEEAIFKIRDTLTSRAEIGDLARLFENDVISIIGLGGTGSYVLDFLVKTPVREIRAFDMDKYYVHNAFRSPGRLEVEGDRKELGVPKAQVYASRYENFRHGLRIEPRFIDESSGELLAGSTFAFVCVDKGSARKQIFDLLEASKIPFIDVGIGLARKNNGPISGTVRTTYFPSGNVGSVRGRYVSEVDAVDDVYKANIQIAELNALNACLAVLRFKQLRGFYAGSPNAVQHLFTLDNLTLGLE